MLRRRTVLKGMAATAVGGLLARPVIADTTLKIGCSLPLTGAGFTAVGRELTGALKVYMQQHGSSTTKSTSSASASRPVHLQSRSW
jgi:hypothetical protein